MRHTLQLFLAIAVFLRVCSCLINCSDRHKVRENVSSSGGDSSETKYFEDSVLISQGKSLFVENCNACHSISNTDNFLAGVVRRDGVDYLKLYLTRQDSLIRAKNAYAVKLKEVFGGLANAHNFKFSDRQLNAIIAYLKKYSS